MHLLHYMEGVAAALLACFSVTADYGTVVDIYKYEVIWRSALAAIMPSLFQLWLELTRDSLKEQCKELLSFCKDILKA